MIIVKMDLITTIRSNTMVDICLLYSQIEIQKINKSHGVSQDQINRKLYKQITFSNQNEQHINSRQENINQITMSYEPINAAYSNQVNELSKHYVNPKYKSINQQLNKLISNDNVC